MPISAYFDSDRSGEARGAERRTLHFETSTSSPADRADAVLVHNASTTGLLLETSGSLTEGDRIEIDLPEAGPTQATVIWSSGRLHGCRFASPISSAALSAAELRSIVARPPSVSPARATASANLGPRLQQLRKARGMTLAELADALSVSKPTVWAWEHGKARPIDSRLPALAEALGVDPHELQQTASATISSEIVERCRMQIAEAAGIALHSVRISIEL